MALKAIKREKNNMNLTTFITWLNAEPGADTVLQRDGIFPMLTWRDLNQPAAAFMSVRTAAYIFILAAALPVLMLS